MKALSLTQPWATLVASGAKRIETRSWPTSYRGPLAIHAAKGFPREAQEVCFEEPFASALLRAGIRVPNDLPRGAVVAVARLAGIQPTVLTLNEPHPLAPAPDSDEWAFGDYGPRRFMWFIEGVQALPEPIPAKGALGLWEWTPPSGEGMK